MVFSIYDGTNRYHFEAGRINKDVLLAYLHFVELFKSYAYITESS